MTRRAITRARLIDGTGAQAAPSTTVIWEDRTITWVGPDAEADLEGAEVTDAAGASLLPGLIDAHVHLVLDASLEGVDRLATEPLNEIVRRADDNAARLLHSGITSARDQGSRQSVAIGVAERQRSGQLVAARIFAAGRGITAPGGHGWMMGVQVEGPDGVRQAVAEEIERGADVIKLFPTGGVLGSGAHGFEVTMTKEEISAAVAEAHAGGKLVGAHVHGAEGVALCLAAGVDTIEHGTGLSAEQAAQMVDRDIALVPTMMAVEVLAGRTEVAEDLAERVAEIRPIIGETVRRAIESGVRVLAGTDAGTPFNPPGGLYREMTLLAGLGLGNAGAIAAATSGPARVLGLTDLGSVEAGRRADLLLVEADPLTDLAALASPRLVVQDGEIT